jgi:hypothetical protein
LDSPFHSLYCIILGIGDEKTKRVESQDPENSAKDDESLANNPAAADPLPAPETEFPVGLDFIKLSPQSVHSNSNDFDPMDFEFGGDDESSIYPGSVVKVKVQSEDDYDMTTNNQASREINTNIKQENDESTSDESEDGWEPPKPLSKKSTKSRKKLDCPMCKKKNFSSVKLFKLHFEKIHLGILYFFMKLNNDITCLIKLFNLQC